MRQNRKYTCKQDRAFQIEQDGSFVTELDRRELRYPERRAPMFIGDGVIGEAGHVYVVLGDLFDPRGHRAHKATDCIAHAMGKDPDQVRFLDGNTLNIRLGNLAWEPEKEPAPKAENGRSVNHASNKMVECPHCGEQVTRLTLTRHCRHHHGYKNDEKAEPGSTKPVRGQQ